MHLIIQNLEVKIY